MIWFDIKKLEKELIDENLSDKEGFNYLLANMILFSVAPYIAVDRYENSWLTFVEVVITIFITVIMLRTTYDINLKGSENKDYFKRFLGLSFVSGVRLVVYVVVAAIPVGIFMALAGKLVTVDRGTKDILMLAMQIAIAIVYYFMLTNSFRRVNGEVK